MTRSGSEASRDLPRKRGYGGVDGWVGGGVIPLLVSRQINEGLPPPLQGAPWRLYGAPVTSLSRCTPGWSQAGSN